MFVFSEVPAKIIPINFILNSGSPTEANALSAAIIGGGVGASVGAVVLLMVIISVTICVSTKRRKRNTKCKQFRKISCQCMICKLIFQQHHPTLHSTMHTELVCDTCSDISQLPCTWIKLFH